MNLVFSQIYARHKVWIYTISPLLAIPFCEWIATTPIGTAALLTPYLLVYMLPAMVAVLCSPFLLLCLAFKKARQKSLRYLLFSLVFVPCCVGGLKLGVKIRTAGMVAFVNRSRPLVAAIHKYEKDHAVPPASLEQLIPDYLPEYPSTGMMAYPTYDYFTGKYAKNFDNNRWVLYVFTPHGGINFDAMLYFPDQNYPQHGHGGWLERIGDWAYVHE